MVEKITDKRSASSEAWESLESWVRGKVQDFVQAVLEEEVTELLGRAKSVRRAAVDADVGYRNGHGKPRRLTLSSGTITVRRPRVRDLEERFESQVLPLFAKRTREVDGLIPELYLHGLAEGDFESCSGAKGVALGGDALVGRTWVRDSYDGPCCGDQAK